MNKLEREKLQGKIVFRGVPHTFVSFTPRSTTRFSKRRWEKNPLGLPISSRRRGKQPF